MSEYVHKSHNILIIICHIVCPAKYRRVVIDENVDKTIKETCEGIGKRYEIKFLEIGTEKDHVYFLIQSIPTYSQKNSYNDKRDSIKACIRRTPRNKKAIMGRRILE